MSATIENDELLKLIQCLTSNEVSKVLRLRPLLVPPTPKGRLRSTDAEALSRETASQTIFDFVVKWNKQFWFYRPVYARSLPAMVQAPRLLAARASTVAYPPPASRLHSLSFSTVFMTFRSSQRSSVDSYREGLRFYRAMCNSMKDWQGNRLSCDWQVLEDAVAALTAEEFTSRAAWGWPR